MLMKGWLGEVDSFWNFLQKYFHLSIETQVFSNR